jgi:hypothetical protein
MVQTAIGSSCVWVGIEKWKRWREISMGGQDQWKWCSRCGTLGSDRNRIGPCQDGGNHDYSRSANYRLIANDTEAPGQSNWNYCHKCEQLVYVGGSHIGECAAGGEHDHGFPPGSFNYTVMINAQPDWRWCARCMALVYTGNPDRGRLPCPGPGGDGFHNFEGSGPYSLTDSWIT